jgi:NADH dehydrogenase/NADH:ubiquinone oxidoreductase subunit G
VHKVTIDGIITTVKTGTTILEAAGKIGVWIPTLCYNPTLAPSGSCRLCMVEIKRGNRTQLVTSCTYPIRSDLTVFVNSERAQKARKGVMQLLLARAPESEELRELAARMGVEGTPYPTVTESQRNCILCGLCVQVCEQVMGCSAIGFAGRGVERAVATPFRLASENCIACGACAMVCPVGTIQIRIHKEAGEAEISPFKSRAKLMICEGCGTRMVTEPVGNTMLKKVDMDWEEFRKRARLCPECRRKYSAESLALLAVRRGGIEESFANPVYTTNNR